jgi:3-oxoacyl-[acyl-carrier-protein] synthase II
MRNAPICAEVLGFATVSDTSNIANPDSAAVRLCMEQALADARIGPDRIDYVNAHATGTEAGDVAESEAISGLLGPLVPVSSLKGHLGHSMAASGALEMVATVMMMTEGRIIPTRNLEEIDDRCSGIRHVQKLEEGAIRTALKNNFALGGVNACVVLGRYDSDR